MTRFAQRHAVKHAEEFSFQHGLVAPVDVQQGRNLDNVMHFNGSIAGCTDKATPLASVVVALETCKAPQFVFLGLADALPYFGDTASPVPVFRPSLQAVSFRLKRLAVGHFGTVARQKFRNALGRVMKLRDHNHGVASAVAAMFALVFFNPLINALVVSPAEQVRAALTGAKSPLLSAVEVDRHTKQGYTNELESANKIKRSSKSDELQETRPSNVEGNLQPSQEYTSGRFIDYRRGTSPLNNRIQRPTLKAKSDEIVSARRNAGQRVRSFNFIGAQVVVDQYAPSGSMYGMNTRQENLMFFTSTLKRYQFGSSVGPTVAKSTAVKFSLIKLNPEMGTDCKQGVYQLPGTRKLTENVRAAVTTERENILRDDATVCSATNAKLQKSAEMTDSLPSSSVTTASQASRRSTTRMTGVVSTCGPGISSWRTRDTTSG